MGLNYERVNAQFKATREARTAYKTNHVEYRYWKGQTKQLDKRVIKVKDGEYFVRLTSALQSILFSLGTGDRSAQRKILGLSKADSLYERSNRWISLETFEKLERLGFTAKEWPVWLSIKLWWQNKNGGKDWYRLNGDTLDSRLKRGWETARKEELKL